MFVPPLASAIDLTRRQVPSRFPALPQLAFSIDVPSDFIAPSLPDEPPNFDEATFMMPLWLASSPIAFAIVSVAARPAYDDGSVIHWLRFLAEAGGLNLTSLMPGHIGPHPAILAEAKQVQDGVEFSFVLGGIEDGGDVFVLQAMVPAALQPSFGGALRSAISSFSLLAPRGPTRPLIPDGPIPSLCAKAERA